MLFKTATSLAVPFHDQTIVQLQTASCCVQKQHCSDKQKQRKTELPKHVTNTAQVHIYFH